MGGTQDQTIAPQHDGQIGFYARDVFLAAEIFGDDLGILLDDGAEPPNFVQKVGPLAGTQQDDVGPRVAGKRKRCGGGWGMWFL